MGAALERWQQELAGWAIPPDIEATAPAEPWACPAAAFRADDAPAWVTPSTRVSREALPEGGSVLDVGCGGGAAAMALVPPAGRVVGVDESAEMLDAFAAAARTRHVPHGVVQGRWPDVAGQVGTADVVVAHHVVYNVPDLDAFARALSRHARHRVVLELTATHPMTASAPLWRHFHGLERPDGPHADLVVEVLAEAGFTPHLERWTRPARHVPFDVRVAMMRRRLCLPTGREPEVAEQLAALGDAPRDVVTLWWP